MDVKGRQTPRDLFTSPTKTDDKNNEQEIKGETTAWLLDLPLAIIYDILFRLNTGTILTCRCVCKTFQNILKDPQFAEFHLTKTPDISNGLVIQDRDTFSNNLFVEDYQHDSRTCQALSMPTIAARIYNVSVTLVGACNGLLCLCYKSTNWDLLYYICNPILGEFLALPCDIKLFTKQPSAFGFCEKTKKYKIIRFCSHSLCKIHTIGTDNWRTIQSLPNPWNIAASSLRGNLHWIVNLCTVSELICSFNLETEQASFIPPPIHLNHPFPSKASSIQISSIGGLLCLGYLLDRHFEIYVMKDYGVKESWTKDFTIDLTIVYGPREMVVYPMPKLMENRDLLLFKYKKSSLACYDIRKGTVTKLIAKKVTAVDVMAFVPSFVSLKDIAAAAGKNLEIVNRKRGRNLWSDEGFQFAG